MLLCKYIRFPSFSLNFTHPVSCFSRIRQFLLPWILHGGPQSQFQSSADAQLTFQRIVLALGRLCSSTPPSAYSTASHPTGAEAAAGRYFILRTTAPWSSLDGRMRRLCTADSDNSGQKCRRSGVAGGGTLCRRGTPAAHSALQSRCTYSQTGPHCHEYRQ